MYFTIGWTKNLEGQDVSLPNHVFCNRDRSLFGVLTNDSVTVWFVKPSVEITCYRRCAESVDRDGSNYFAEWRTDSSMIVVATNQNHLLFFNVDVDESIKGLYEHCDSKLPGLRRESAELFIREKIPPISLVLVHNLALPGFICSLVCIRDELMVATDDGNIWRVLWDSVVIDEYSLTLSNIPFCIDQQQCKGSFLNTKHLYCISLEYSPIIGGFSIVFSNGQAAFITASSLKFQPNTVFGILAQEVNDAICTAVNHRYRLIAYGLKSAQGIVFSFDDLTGALQITHRLTLSARDFPDAVTLAGSVTNLKWTPDGGALAMIWERGGMAVWSVFGSLIMCTLGWDYGLTDVMKNVLKISSMEWGPEGYHLWIVCKKPQAEQKTHLAVLQFAKSALTANANMTGREHVFLQSDDRLYISAGSDIVHNRTSVGVKGVKKSPSSPAFSQDQMGVGNKQWIIVPISCSYLASNWPIRYAAIDAKGQNIAVAGRSGIAHYSLIHKRWKLFGNETQEKDFVVMGGLLWWEDQIILGCFNLQDLKDEIRIYPQESKLDNQFAHSVKMSNQVLQLSCLGRTLLCFCANSHLTLFHLQRKSSPTSSILNITLVLEFDITNLVFHPACVVSTMLTSLCTESGRQPHKNDGSILLNVCGRLLLLQQDPISKASDITNNNNQAIPTYSAPTVLASSVENVWICSRGSREAPHLTEALWIACGSHGMRVWLPLFPREGEKHRSHNFMSKRIMLPVDVYIYPLAVLFEDAVILGAESDTVLFSANIHSGQPYCVISRTSQVYLHYILRQLLRRNLGYHAWEIARSCANLQYFPHSLELLLHEVLEEEATSSEPIPDALLPRVIDFIQEFPVFLETVVQCARKTELALWPYLFSAVGNPKNLFRACINQGMLDTAASYLIILQNLEVLSVSHQHAAVLLDNALDAGKWELANELVRFLKAIGPSDVESPPRSIGPLNKYILSHATPPVSPTEDDLSFVLGTMSLTRGRSHSVAATQKALPEQENRVAHQDVSKTVSDPHNIRKKQPSELKEKDWNKDEFFIDVLLSGHARKLLGAGKLKDLGYMAAHLDFHLVSFFSKEKNRAASIVDFITALHALHKSFQWPYPMQQDDLLVNFHKQSRTALPSAGPAGYSIVNAKENSIYENSVPNQTHAVYNDKLMPKCESIGERDSLANSIDAYLLPKTSRENNAYVVDISENNSLWAEESHTTLDDESWTSYPLSAELEAMAEDLVCRGPPEVEIQLRYLLQLLQEAGCLDWSLVIAIILRDAMAVIRVLNSAKQPDHHCDTSKHLREALMAIEMWAEKECPGYKAFMLAIRNQARVLGKVGSMPSSNLQIDSLSYDELYENTHYKDDQNSLRLSTSSDVPSIDGTLVLQSTCTEVANEELSMSESEESEKLEENQKHSSECVIS